jgi:hypothetical protein
VLDEALAGLPELRGNFCQPNCRFSGFDLAKERPNAGEFVLPPVLE